MTTRDRRLPAFISDNLLRRIVLPPEKKVSALVSPGETVADLGCGPGYFTLPLGRLVGQKGKVFAVDSDEEAIRRVRTKVAREGLEGVVEPRVSSASDVAFIGDGSVDFVFAEGLLCCMTDHPGALDQMRRIMKDDGRAYISVARLAKRSDPRSVGSEEWQKTLSHFKVVECGQSLFSRWALVSKGGDASSPAPGVDLVGMDRLRCPTCFQADGSFRSDPLRDILSPWRPRVDPAYRMMASVRIGGRLSGLSTGT